MRSDFVSRSGSALVGRARGLCGVARGCPAAEELQVLFGAGRWLGGVGEDRQSVVRWELQAVESEVDVADDGVVEPFDGGVVEADVVLRPAGAERLALGGEFADEV